MDQLGGRREAGPFQERWKSRREGGGSDSALLALVLARAFSCLSSSTPLSQQQHAFVLAGTSLTLECAGNNSCLFGHVSLGLAAIIMPCFREIFCWLAAAAAAAAFRRFSRCTYLGVLCCSVPSTLFSRLCRKFWENSRQVGGPTRKTVELTPAVGGGCRKGATRDRQRGRSEMCLLPVCPRARLLHHTPSIPTNLRKSQFVYLPHLQRIEGRRSCWASGLAFALT